MRLTYCVRSWVYPCNRLVLICVFGVCAVHEVVDWGASFNSDLSLACSVVDTVANFVYFSAHSLPRACTCQACALNDNFCAALDPICSVCAEDLPRGRLAADLPAELRGRLWHNLSVCHSGLMVAVYLSVSLTLISFGQWGGLLSAQVLQSWLQDRFLGTDDQQPFWKYALFCCDCWARRLISASCPLARQICEGRASSAQP